MENTIKRAIRFSDKKIIMKPIEGKGLVETWMTNPPIESPITQFIRYKGDYYYLISSIDKSQPTPSE